MKRPRFRVRALMIVVAIVALLSAVIVQFPYGDIDYNTLDPRYWREA